MAGTFFQTSVNIYYSLSSRINFTDLGLDHPEYWDCKGQSGQAKAGARGEGFFSEDRKREKRVTYDSNLFKAGIMVNEDHF